MTLVKCFLANAADEFDILIGEDKFKFYEISNNTVLSNLLSNYSYHAE